MMLIMYPGSPGLQYYLGGRPDSSVILPAINFQDVNIIDTLSSRPETNITVLIEVNNLT